MGYGRGTSGACAAIRARAPRTPPPEPIARRAARAGWFDGVPRHLRVGPWSPIAVAVLLSFAVALVVLKPPLSPLVHVTIPELYSAGWWRDAAVGTWGALVLARCVSVWGRWPMLVSYTGWSWNFLTLRAALGAAAPLLCAASPTPATPPSCAALGTAAIALSEGLRLAVGLQAFVVTSVWNVILFPFIALVLFSDPQKRRDFVRWNFGFELVQVCAARRTSHDPRPDARPGDAPPRGATSAAATCPRRRPTARARASCRTAAAP